MRHHRFMHLFGKSLLETVETSALAQTAGLGGFVANPLAGAVTAAQAQIYEAAFQMAQKQHAQDEEWPMAECWN